MAEKEERSAEKTISDDLVVVKYKMTGEIVNRVLKEVIDKCVDGASVQDVCEFGDNRLSEETGKVFKKEKRKGIAFPTCVSVNNCICHYSPLPDEEDTILKDGDVCKIDMGGHIDGFIALVGHTIVVGASVDNMVTGRKADVITAAHLASEAALRLVRPGNQTNEVTEKVQKIAEAFNCKPVEGMLSHQLKQFRIDGEKSIIQNPSDSQKKEHENYDIEVHEVYAVDVLISTGEGVGKQQDTRVTVYKKTDEIYNLKLRTSRNFFSEVCNKYGNMPFNLRHFAGQKKAKMGVKECVTHKTLEPFQVLYEKPGEYVAQFKFTVLLMPNGSHKITGLPFEQDLYKSDCKIQDASIDELLNIPVDPKLLRQQKLMVAKALAAEAPLPGPKGDHAVGAKSGAANSAQVQNSDAKSE